jgi:putative ABC transport system ATP-binding protein
MSIIQTQSVSKVYNETDVPVHAVNGVSVSFEEGEFAAVVGPSGSGKTTLLNMIGGLDRPTEGEVVVAGTRLNDLTTSELTDFRLRSIGFVFQSFNLIPVLTAMENVEFVMQLQGRSEKECRRRATELLEHVGLKDRLDSLPRQLSGGQQQRVAVARALASRPKFVLADEPTASLDSKSTSNLLDIMQNLNRDEGVTFIFSTHDNRVIKKARRIVTIEDGAVAEDREASRQ